MDFTERSVDAGVSGTDFPSDDERYEYVVHRIEEKLVDYDGYDFSIQQIRALNIFFDLAQELRGRDMFYAVCMMIPRVLFGLESNIYILEDEDTLRWPPVRATSAARTRLAHGTKN